MIPCPNVRIRCAGFRFRARNPGTFSPPVMRVMLSAIELDDRLTRNWTRDPDQIGPNRLIWFSLYKVVFGVGYPFE